MTLFDTKIPPYSREFNFYTLSYTVAISMKNSKIFILKPKHSTHLCSQTVVIIYDGSNRDIATEDFRGFDMKAVTAAGNLTAKSAVIPVQRVVGLYH